MAPLAAEAPDECDGYPLRAGVTWFERAQGAREWSVHSTRRLRPRSGPDLSTKRVGVVHGGLGGIALHLLPQDTLHFSSLSRSHKIEVE